MENLESRQLLSATSIQTISGQYLDGPAQSTQLTLSEYFDDTEVTGSVVAIETAQGTFHVETFDTITPLSTQNFLSLIESGNYEDMFFHRKMDGFVLQGGGFEWAADAESPAAIDHNGNIDNEFDNWYDPELGGLEEGAPLNLRGTIAMAKQAGNPDSATSQWFVNVGDNSANLDSQNGGFTVFAHVLYDGMDVVDEMMTLTAVNAGGAFTNLPVVDWEPGQNITAANVVRSTTTVVEELTYDVSVTNGDGEVTAEIVDGVMTLTSTSTTGQGYATVVVSATDVGGNVAEQTFRVAVGLPADVTVTGPADIPSSSPEITWQAAGGAESYDLWVSKMSDLSPLSVEQAGVIRENGITETTFSETSELQPGVYRAWVRAGNSAGLGSWSTPFDFAVGLSEPERAAIDAVTPDSTNARRVTLDWADVDQAAGYQVWIVDSAGTIIVNEVVSENSFYTDFDLTSGETYRAWVRGVNYAFEGAWSSVRSFVADASTEPVTITNPTVASGITDSARPLIEWDSATSYGEYDVWVSQVGTAGAYLRETSTTTSFQPAADLPEGIYRVWVRPPAASGVAWSTPVTIGVGTKAEITAPNGGGISATPTITWSSGIPGTTSQVWLSGPTGRVLFETELTGVSLDVTESLPDGNYTVWVRQAPPVGGVFGWSEGHRFEVGTDTTPGTPTLSVSDSAGTFTFNWQEVSNAVRYELWVNSPSTTRVIHETQLTGTSFDEVLTETGSYRAWLRAFNSNGVAGAWSVVEIFSVS